MDGEKHSLIRVSWLTSFFVVGDITGLAIQGVGMLPHSFSLYFVSIHFQEIVLDVIVVVADDERLK